MAVSSSPKNRSIVLDSRDRERLAAALAESRSLGAEGEAKLALPAILDHVICGEAEGILSRLPPGSVDLLIADPPYNINKKFGLVRGRPMDDEAYEAFTAAWLAAALPLLKPGASVYVFGEWRGSSALYRALSRFFLVRNRIVWEREKGRAATRNWKSAHEEIWFATLGETYFFNAEAVRQRRRVMAPYRDQEGRPKDWEEDEQGRFRDSAASNIWTDLSVPYWSMPENTPHPTQKPEKLLAKLLLASSRPGDLILDPFLGSGTTAVTAKKLGRHFIGIELDQEHCLYALRRLELAALDTHIQGYEDEVFWERNSAPPHSLRKRSKPS